MNVTLRNWQTDAAGSYSFLYKNQETAAPGPTAADKISETVQEAVPVSPAPEEPKAGSASPADKNKDRGEKDKEMDLLLSSIKKMAEQASASKASGSNNKNGKMKSSMPEDSVGQLASLLAKAETKADVLQVSSKATRALSNLKIAAAFSDGKDKQKIQQMIRRMEKLVKRINKKLRCLNQEEQMEMRKKAAEHKMDMDEAKEIGEELRRKRTKRRREEQKYAKEELNEDQKIAMEEMFESMAGMASSPVPQGGTDAGGGVDAAAEAVSAAMDFSMPEVSLDISV